MASYWPFASTSSAVHAVCAVRCFVTSSLRCEENGAEHRVYQNTVLRVTEIHAWVLTE